VEFGGASASVAADIETFDVNGHSMQVRAKRV